MSINKYSIILSPITAGSTYLKNRMIHPNASPHFLQGPEEYPADAYIAHYSGIARSGAAIVTMAEWDNWPEQRTAPAPTPDFVHMQAFNVKSGGVQNYICAMLEDIHFYGSKALIALEPQVKRDKQASHPAGAQVPGFDDIPDLSKGLSHAPKRRIIAMTPAQEEESINEFIDKIAFYHDLGYDGISVRVDKFIRKASNPERTLEQRCAFFVNALKRAREVFGKHFIIDLTVQGQEPLGYDGRIAPGEGYSVEDMISVCRMVEGTVDIITLRGKDVAAAHPLPCHFKKGCQETLEYARALKNAGIRAIVAVNGGYQDPDDIERELEAGTFDMVDRKSVV